MRALFHIDCTNNKVDIIKSIKSLKMILAPLQLSVVQQYSVNPSLPVTGLGAVVTTDPVQFPKVRIIAFELLRYTRF